MANPIYVDVPSMVLERRRWIQAMQQEAREEERDSMAMLVSVLTLGIVTTFCVLAWVMW